MMPECQFGANLRAMARRFEDLIAWQKARLLAAEIASVIRTTQLAAHPAIADQILRAGRSTVANIAEGFERNGRREFHRFLGIAKGSAGEVRAHLYVALDARIIDQPTFDRLRELAEEVSRLVAALRRSLGDQRRPAPR